MPTLNIDPNDTDNFRNAHHANQVAKDTGVFSSDPASPRFHGLFEYHNTLTTRLPNGDKRHLLQFRQIGTTHGTTIDITEKCDTDSLS